jgi:hypothetical protein
MRVLVLIVVFFSCRTVYAQLAENKDFSEEKRKNFETSPYFAGDELLSQINQQDISEILLTRHHDNVLGYIGTNFRRLYIRYISIVKNARDPNEYYVYGKSRVSSNIVEFQGTLTLIASKKFNDQYFEDKTMGSLLGKYVLHENPNQKHVGTFEGYFTTGWILDKTSNELSYNETELGADGFSNNSFVGTWTQYGSNNFKTCNWAEYRIPYSQRYQLGPNDNALDIGAGEFSPADEFDKSGWDTYYTTGDLIMNKIEPKSDIWWKE